jgi:EmrB/QacA subfamily drug resistance transporter
VTVAKTTSDALDRIAREDEPAVAGPTGRLVPMIIGSALFMQTLDATVISNALPTMAKALHEDPLTLNLAITAYLLASAVFLPISGWVADRFGAKTVFRVAIGLFAISSLGCGLSHSLPQLVAARMFQGMAGAMMAPVGRLVLLRSVPKSELVRAMSYLTMPAMLGPVLGPPIGGFIVTHFSWQWIFYINLPIGVLGIVLVSLFIGDVRETKVPPLDWRGFILTGFGLAGVVYGFENLGRGILPFAVVAGLFVGGAVCLGLYALHIRTAPYPLIDISLLKVRTFMASVVGGVFLRMSMGATPFMLALLLQIGFGMDALAAGLMTFASAAGALVMKTTARPILARFGFKAVLVSNTVITAVIFMGYSAFSIGTPHWLIIITLLIGGFFRSLQFTALNAMAYADIPQDRMSQASSLSSMGQQLSQSIGIGTAAILLHVIQGLHHSPTLRPAEVSPAFFIIGLISMGGLIFFVPLPKDVAAEVSGRKPRAAATPEPHRDLAIAED